MKPKEDDPRPFFWLFENVTFMETKVKADICRFLEVSVILLCLVKTQCFLLNFKNSCSGCKIFLSKEKTAEPLPFLKYFFLVTWCNRVCLFFSVTLCLLML